VEAVAVSNRNDTFVNKMMGKYKLENLLAQGGMARVYRAVDNLDRRVAVKVLITNQDWVDETIIQRFKREAHAVANLDNHDNIVTIYDYGETDDAYYIAMQYIEGKDLRQTLREYAGKGQTIPVDRALHIMRQVASALDFAHKNGIIHRDIKPSNVLLTAEDKAMLTDFGLVLSNTDATMGTAFGTPRYIAPEQAVASQQAVPESDVYSLAVIMFEALTGQTPFDGDTPMEIALAHVSEAPPLPTSINPALPKAIDAVMMKALEKEPKGRYRSASEFVEAVAEVFGGQAPSQAGARPVQHTTSATATAAVPSPIAGGTTTPTQAKRGGGRGGLMAVVVVLLLAAIGGGAFFLMGGMGTGNTNGAEIVLIYDANQFSVYNSGDYEITETSRLKFVSGADDGQRDYNAQRILPGQRLPAGECFYIFQTGINEPRPSLCNTLHGQESFNTSGFWWRTDLTGLATFEVQWDGRRIALCDTVSVGASPTECRFNYPLLPVITDDGA
jgi:tRNA A-37 threonylcarbamoyl transferase component Bud32